MLPYFALGLGVLATSYAAIFIRLADAPALVIAAGRLCIASLIVVPVAAWRARPEVLSLKRRDVALALLSGIFLALHFALWISSLQFTSVASSLALVTTSPLWVALASVLFMRERIGWYAWMGISVAFAGGLVIGGGDFQLGGTAFVGDLLALSGGVAVAGYFLFGRRLRARLSLLTYVTLVYSAAALCLLAVIPVTGALPACCSSQSVAMMVLLALIPQLLGHSAYNFALRSASATAVSVATLGEPIGSTLLATLVLGEVPPPTALAGGALVLAGIAAVLLGEAKAARQPERLKS